MNLKFFSPINILPLLTWLSSAIFFTIIQTGCHAIDEKKPVTDQPAVTKVNSTAVQNWVSLDIKFKPETSDEMKAMSIHEIEKLITDSVNKMRLGKYKNFAPKITITQNPWASPLYVNISYSNYLQDSLPPTSCPNPCQNRCGVCFMVTYVAANPVNPISKYIETVSDPIEEKR
jgi:hypothetical protein